MFVHQQQDSTDSYKYLLRASSFEAHKALVCCGAAVSHTQSTQELHFKMNKGLQDLAFPLFFFKLLLLQNKKIYRLLCGSCWMYRCVPDLLPLGYSVPQQIGFPYLNEIKK